MSKYINMMNKIARILLYNKIDSTSVAKGKKILQFIQVSQSVNRPAIYYVEKLGGWGEAVAGQATIVDHL